MASVALRNQVVAEKKPLEVVSTIWLAGDDRDPPTLELRLSSGRYLKLSFDWDYKTPLLWAAADEHADYESIPFRESGLGDALEPFIDEVANAAEAHARQQDEEGPERASAMWSQHGGGGR